MATFRMTNNLLEEGHPGRHTDITQDHPLLTTVVARLTCLGYSTEDTAKAMALHQEILGLEVGTSITRTRDVGSIRAYDVTITRMED